MMKKILHVMVYMVTGLSLVSAAHTANVMGVFSPWAQPQGTGFFSLLNFAGYLAIFFTCLLGMLHFHRKVTLTAYGMKLVYVVTIMATFEILAVMPCFMFKADALCGVFSIMIHQLAGPVAIIIFMLLIGQISQARIRKILVFGLTACVLLIAAQHWLRAPKTVEDCAAMSSALERSNCIDRFALAAKDPELCMQISFDFVRFSCLYQVAAALNDRSICDKIKNLPGDDKAAPTLPSDANQYKNTCLKLTEKTNP